MDNIIIEVFGIELYKIIVIYFTILFLIAFTILTISLIKEIIKNR